MTSFWRRLRLTLEMIKFEHSVFALPFALTGAMLAWRETGFRTEGLAWRLLWIVVAMVSARSAAMTFNRILDADIDGRNKRTASRALPAGLLTIRFAWVFTLVSTLVFFWASQQLGRLCLALAPVALAIIFTYSVPKPFPIFGHFVVGFPPGLPPRRSVDSI